MAIPKQCSWVVRKILGAREYLKKVRNGEEILKHHIFSVRKVYMLMMGDMERVPWAKMICQNPAPAKCVFIVWLLLYGKLATCSYLSRMGIQTDPTCCLCDRGVEDLDHLFFACEVVQEI